ncbi:hypothetical protein BDZ91DRAFT_711669 [Kalaharituber pfeilii]|nr:hypothetical protein BDZ91DRAFT_711669 [Kalaharituber pfeilii]
MFFSLCYSYNLRWFLSQGCRREVYLQITFYFSFSFILFENYFHLGWPFVSVYKVVQATDAGVKRDGLDALAGFLVGQI